MARMFEMRRYLSNFEVSRVGHLLTDVLVVGSGIAGARAAIEASQHGDVILVTKAQAADSATGSAQGGIAEPSGSGDTPDNHVNDTLRVGSGLNATAAVRYMVEQAEARIEELIRWGASFDQEDSVAHRTREAGHSVRRVIHADGDSTGKELARTLITRLHQQERVRLFENCYVIDLITMAGQCVGAVTYHAKYGHQMIWAKQTILASGGCGQLYRETTNPSVATGDGLAAAYRAGAVLGDLEMVQFHPTTLYIAGSSRALISEAVRGEGAHLVDRAGERFMPAYHPDAELAPRDVVSRAIRSHLKDKGGNCVYLDARMFGKGVFEARFPRITRICAEFGIDVSRELIPVNPGAHYMLGGVVTDLACRTNIDGLLACGEAACVGIHGANRLASNSLLEGLVFGAVAGETAGNNLATTEQLGPSLNIGSLNPSSDRTVLDVGDVRTSLRSVMWRNIGVVRTGHRLRETVEIMEFWGRFVLDKTFDQPSGWELQNMLGLARLVAQAAQLRDHSLGVHFREDSEANNGPSEPQHLLVVKSDDGPVYSWAPPCLKCPAESLP